MNGKLRRNGLVTGALTPLAPLSQPGPPPSRERGERQGVTIGASAPHSPLPGVREGGLGEGPGVRACGGGLWLTLALTLLLTLTACGSGDGTSSPTTAEASKSTEQPAAPEASAEAGSEARAARAALVRTAHPAVEDVVDEADLPADLQPLRRAVLAAEVPGTVEAVEVEEGQAVTRGQELVRVDTRELEQRVAEAEALHRQADAQQDRAEALFERRSITQKDLDDAITSKDVAEARLASAKLDLEKSKVKAPWSGRVTDKRVEVGDYVVPGQPVVELVEVSRLKVRAPAPASDVPYLKVGVPAEVRVDAFPGETFEGKVVRLAAELDPDARTLDVEVEIPNRDGRLRPGMLARVKIPRRTLKGALLLPLESVVDLGDRRVVYVVEDGLAHRREIELGPTVGERVVIQKGLSADDRVVVEGTQNVAEGQAVREAEAG
jgi:membrane fusion protein (multidrug efflux system)